MNDAAPLTPPSAYAELHFQKKQQLKRHLKKQEMSLKKTNGVGLKKEGNITQG